MNEDASFEELTQAPWRLRVVVSAGKRVEAPSTARLTFGSDGRFAGSDGAHGVSGKFSLEAPNHVRLERVATTANFYAGDDSALLATIGAYELLMTNKAADISISDQGRVLRIQVDDRTALLLGR